jgi:hypothetical protein
MSPLETKLKLKSGILSLEALEKESFVSQLKIHMDRGTRPNGTPLRTGVEWTEYFLVEEIIRVASQNIIHSRSRRFFGDNETLAPFRAAFYKSWKAAWNAENEESIVDFEYGLQVPDEAMLMSIYSFDEHAYVGSDERETPDISKELFKEWWVSYGAGFLYSSRNEEPFAVTGLFPVPSRWAELFARHETTEHELRGEMIKNAMELTPSTHWYFSGLASKETLVIRRESSTIIHRESLTGIHSHLSSIIGFSLLAWLKVNRRLKSVPELIFVAEGTTEIGTRLLNSQFRFEMTSPGIAERKPRYRMVASWEQIIMMLIRNEFFTRDACLQEAVQDFLQNLH